MSEGDDLWALPCDQMDWVAVEPQTETEMGLIFPPVWSPVGWERRKTPHTCVNTQHTRHRSQTLVNIKWQLMNWKHTFCIVCYDDHTCSTLRLPFNLYCKFHNQLVLLWLNPFHFAPPSPRGSAILFFFFFFFFLSSSQRWTKKNPRMGALAAAQILLCESKTEHTLIACTRK